MKSKTLCKEIQELEKQRETLIKQKQEEQIKEGIAYQCIKCEKTVVKERASPGQLETKLCNECLMFKRKKVHKEDTIIFFYFLIMLFFFVITYEISKKVL